MAPATCPSPWASTPTMTRAGSGCAMVVVAVSLPDKADGWVPAERADNTARSLWRPAGVRSRSLGWCLPGRWPRRRADISRPRHQASENSGQTRPTATTGIIAVNPARPAHSPTRNPTPHRVAPAHAWRTSAVVGLRRGACGYVSGKSLAHMLVEQSPIRRSRDLCSMRALGPVRLPACPHAACRWTGWLAGWRVPRKAAARRPRSSTRSPRVGASHSPADQQEARASGCEKRALCGRQRAAGSAVPRCRRGSRGRGVPRYRRRPRADRARGHQPGQAAPPHSASRVPLMSAHGGDSSGVLPPGPRVAARSLRPRVRPVAGAGAVMTAANAPLLAWGPLLAVTSLAYWWRRR
jgi:hypothetical protein